MGGLEKVPQSAYVINGWSISSFQLSTHFIFSPQHSGFDRGHLAAAANHRMNQNLCDETFLLSNMAPQVCKIR